VVTRTLVDPADPAFTRATKPVGRYLPAAEARVMIEHGETWEDRGERGWRRMVASPEPLAILDADTVRTLVADGFVTVANGGGGIPVVRDPDGSLRGIAAVIDKDLGAALLAAAVLADVLVIATDIEAAVLGYGTAEARPLGEVSVAELRKYAADGQFAGGSMGPKVEAVCRFIEHGGRRGVITSLDRIPEAVAGRAGTVVVPA
jgi:carbamate kinase